MSGRERAATSHRPFSTAFAIIRGSQRRPATITGNFVTFFTASEWCRWHPLASYIGGMILCGV